MMGRFPKKLSVYKKVSLSRIHVPARLPQQKATPVVIHGIAHGQLLPVGRQTSQFLSRSLSKSKRIYAELYPWLTVPKSFRSKTVVIESPKVVIAISKLMGSSANKRIVRALKMDVIRYFLEYFPTKSTLLNQKQAKAFLKECKLSSVEKAVLETKKPVSDIKAFQGILINVRNVLMAGEVLYQIRKDPNGERTSVVVGLAHAPGIASFMNNPKLAVRYIDFCRKKLFNQKYPGTEPFYQWLGNVRTVFENELSLSHSAKS